MSSLWLLSRRQLPIIVSCIVLCALMVTAYQRGYVNGRQERTAYYSVVLAEQNRLAARASAEALQRQRHEMEAAAALERELLEAQVRQIKEQKVVTRVVKEYINARPSLDHCRLDADGLRLWNAGTAQRRRQPVSRGARCTDAAVR